MSKSKSNVKNLLAAIQRKAPVEQPSAGKTKDAPLSVAEPITANLTAEQTDRSAATRAKKKSRVGRPVQFWFHEEDRRVLRELAAWLAGQGVRSTDSMVVRAALRSVQTGSAFLEAYRAAALLDGRLKRD